MIARNLSRSIAQSLSHPITGRDNWTPRKLFLDVTEGVFFEILPRYCFQDAAGTTPANVGDPVGFVEDQSGNGNHATQSIAASRPILRQDAGGRYYLEFDGVDDYVATAAFSSPIAQPNLLAVGRSWNALSGDRHITDGDSTNRQLLIAGSTSGERISAGTFSTGGTVPVVGQVDVLANVFNGASSNMRKNGIDRTVSAGTSSIAQLYIGANYLGSNCGNFKLYGLVLAGKNPSSAELVKIDRFLASKSGVTL